MGWPGLADPKVLLTGDLALEAAKAQHTGEAMTLKDKAGIERRDGEWIVRRADGDLCRW
jgi:hypothetical protein